MNLFEYYCFLNVYCVWWFLVLVLFDEFLIGLGLLIVLCLVPEKMEQNKVMSRVKSVLVFPFVFVCLLVLFSVSNGFVFCFVFGGGIWNGVFLGGYWRKFVKFFWNLFYFLSIFEYFGCLMIHGTCVIWWVSDAVWDCWLHCVWFLRKWRTIK